MTCVVGIVDGLRVMLGADAASVCNDYSGTASRVQKIFRNGEFLIGGTVSWRLLQLARFAFRPPLMAEDADLEGYMVIDFVNAMRECFTEAGAQKIENSVEEGGEFLVAARGRLFHLHTDWQVGENSLGFDACGCGAKFAIGALHCLGHKDDVERRIMKSLKVAAACSVAVMEPFVTDCIDGRSRGAQ